MTSKILQKARKNALFTAMIVGAIGYEVFAHTECQFPLGEAVSPGAYVLWQNLVNGWQLWYKEKYGTLKW